MASSGRKYWSHIAEVWKRKHPQELWRRHSDSVNSDLLRRWLRSNPGAHILKTDLFDEVVSDGLFPLLLEYSDQLIGVDLSPEMVNTVREKFPKLNSRTADVRSLPFENDSFDIIVSNSTLDHFTSRQDIQAALNQLSRVLRPGGQLILTLDNLVNPIVWLRSVLPQGLLLRLGLIPYEVGKTCRPGQLRSFCRSAGFEVKETTTIMHCPRVLAVAGARFLARYGSPRTQSWYLGFLKSFECLERWPSKYFSGHFTAVHARKPLVKGKNTHDVL